MIYKTHDFNQSNFLGFYEKLIEIKPTSKLKQTNGILTSFIDSQRKLDHTTMVFILFVFWGFVVSNRHKNKTCMTVNISSVINSTKLSTNNKCKTVNNVLVAYKNY